MNIRWMLVAAILGATSLVVGAEEKAAANTWKQKQFIITCWMPPPATDENLSTFSAEHYNVTWASVKELDLVAKHGLRAMLRNGLLRPKVLDDPARLAKLDALIEKVKHHPALEAYFITDEPGAGAFAGLGKLVAYLKQRDPEHLAYINLFPTYATEKQLGVSADAAERAKVGLPTNFEGVGVSDKTVLAYREHVKQFIEIVKPDLISYDHYHFLKTGDGKQYFLNLALIRQAALEANRPFLNIIQGSNGVKSWRLPIPTEMRWLIYTTLAYGGRGISYFTYWGPKRFGGLYRDGKPGPLAKVVAALNAEVAKMGPVLLTLDSVGVYHTAPLPYGTEAVPVDAPVQIFGAGEFVLGLFAQAGKTMGFMIVNRNYEKPADAVLKVTIPGQSIEELDRKTGKWSAGPSIDSDRTVHVKLGSGDGRLFRVVQ